MNDKIANAINGWTPLFRVITPITTLLITVLLTMLLTTVSEVKADLKAFQIMVVALDKRLTVIESNRFTSKDAQTLTESILNKLPPKWLLDAVQDNNVRLKQLEKRRH